MQCHINTCSIQRLTLYPLYFLPTIIVKLFSCFRKKKIVPWEVGAAGLIVPLSLSSSKFHQSQVWPWLWRFLNFLFHFFRVSEDNQYFPLYIFVFVFSSPSSSFSLDYLLILSCLSTSTTMAVPIINRMAEFEPNSFSNVLHFFSLVYAFTSVASGIQISRLFTRYFTSTKSKESDLTFCYVLQSAN